MSSKGKGKAKGKAAAKTTGIGMKGEGKATLVPKLRFPQFRREGWVKRKAGSLFANRITKGEQGLPIYSVTTHNGMVKRDSIDRNFYDIEDASGNKKACKNDIAYNMMRMWQGASGVAPVDCLVSPAYIVLAPRKDADPAFFQFLFKLPETLLLLTSHSRGLTKDRLRLYYDNFARIPLLCPTPAEQQRIAECLSSVDEMIAAQARKVEEFKTHKKGLMQELFPREGETRPRLRFREFRKKKEWEPKRLSSEIDLISGMHLPPEQYSPAGDVPYFSGPSDYTDEIKSITKWTKRSANMAAPDDTLITVKGSGVGEVWYSTFPAVAMGRQLMAIRSKQGSSRFIFQFLLTKKTRFEDLGSGNLIPGLSRADILEMEAHFPSPAEQQRIADCLSSLDTLVTAATQKLDALKLHKKALMQQLFPAPEEVEA
ncbi:restriction endonuclease subunit S [Luteolibacter sp. Populi]|uniref:restriction endonuclease subunit S n=1 Tax=Luteolibacter sp. Populi TaxID=3230487 RepID=UPI0034652FD6